jgi:hypothetical protein
LSTFVVHTPLSQMRPVGAEGERSFVRLTALIERHLSARHAAAFADPVPVRDGSGIDWYTGHEGDVLPVSQLDLKDSAFIRAELAGILADLRSSADVLDAAGAAHAQKTATVLRNAAIFPGDQAIFAIRNGDELRPLIVGWGYENQDAAAAHQFSVSAFGRAKPVASPAPSGYSASAFGGAPSADIPTAAVYAADDAGARAVAARSFGWLLPLVPTLLSLLLVGIISAMLIPACGLRTPFGTISFGFPGGFACSGTPVAELGLVPGADRQALQQELALLQQNYNRRRLECRVANPIIPEIQPPAALIPPVPAEQAQRFDERVDLRGEAQITLIWDGPDDLDLWLQCPDRKSIYYEAKNACGGTLDIDQNAGNQISPKPIENITFPSGLVQPGEHRIGVQLYKNKSGQLPLPFQVRIRDGRGSRVLDGRISRESEMVLIDTMTK